MYKHTKEQQKNDVKASSRRRFQTFMSSTWILLIAFAFTVMADPISSVAYAIEAALRALNGNLALLWPTMALVIAIIAVITINYHQLIGHFPEGGGAAAAGRTALGEGWAFLPIGALVVDFVLTISISIAASVSAIVAYFPLLAGIRILLALGLLVLVAGLTCFGHSGRTIFSLMTLAFVGIGVALIATGFLHASHGSSILQTTPSAVESRKVVPIHFLESLTKSCRPSCEHTPVVATPPVKMG